MHTPCRVRYAFASQYTVPIVLELFYTIISLSKVRFYRREPCHGVLVRLNTHKLIAASHIR